MGSAPGGEAALRPRRRRLFFALWPDAACRERLENALQATPAGIVASAGGVPSAASVASGAQAGRRVPPADWHVTLCFLGAVPDSLLMALQAGAARLHAPAFTLHFDRVRYWKQARVLALLGDCPPAAAALSAALRALGRELGLAPEDKPLRPHITLVRGLRASAWHGRRESALELVLPATRFDLAESIEPAVAPAARYRSLAAWPLRG